MEGAYSIVSFYFPGHPHDDFLKELSNVGESLSGSYNDVVFGANEHVIREHQHSSELGKYDDAREPRIFMKGKRNNSFNRKRKELNCLTQYNDPVLITACLRNV
jgi:hypothetical protein